MAWFAACANCSMIRKLTAPSSPKALTPWRKRVFSPAFSSIRKSVVFTGAQLAHDHPQSDGPRNLVDAIRAAAAEEARGLGAMVCFNGELHAGREVTKVHTSAVETFQSYQYGALG